MTIHIRHLYNDTAQTPLARREGQRMLNRYANNDSAETIPQIFAWLVVRYFL